MSHFCFLEFIRFTDWDWDLGLWLGLGTWDLGLVKSVCGANLPSSNSRREHFHGFSFYFLFTPHKYRRKSRVNRIDLRIHALFDKRAWGVRNAWVELILGIDSRGTFVAIWGKYNEKSWKYSRREFDDGKNVSREALAQTLYTWLGLGILRTPLAVYIRLQYKKVLQYVAKK